MSNKLTEHQGNSRHSVIVPYEVGLILDRRDQAHQDLADALVLALDEYRQSGNLDRNVNVVAMHSEGAPHGSVLDFVADWKELLARQTLMAVVGPFGEANGAALLESVGNLGLPLLTYSPSDKFVGSDVFQLPFGHVTDVAHHLLGFALAGKKNRVVVVRESGTSGDAVEAAFQSAAWQLRTGRLHVVERDDRLSAALNDARADAVIYVGGNGHAGIDASLKQAGLNALKLTGIEITSAHPALGACALDGWIGLDMVDDSNPTFQRFSQAFSQRYGRSGDHAYAALGYDMGHVLAMTLAIVRPPSPAGVTAGLNKLRMVPAATGAAGTVISFARYDRRGFRGDPFVLRQAVDGKLRPLAPAAAA